VIPPASAWEPLLERALAEDLGAGDVTSAAVLARDSTLEVFVEARQELVVCGLFIAEAVFERLDPRLRITCCEPEGTVVAAGQKLLEISGDAGAILSAERTALNFLGRMCGVATWTRRHVEAVSGTRAAIVDTRKTLPGFRALDKYAVAVGGGTNHRFGLFDAILIKDNHVAAAGGVGAAVKAARTNGAPHLSVQAEVESLAQALEAVEAGADLLLLDNQTPEELRRYVAALGERIPLEATGGIHLGNVREVAETGVARISLGALTHSAPTADVALEVAVGQGPS
jgi:nicotinate-nucleotide pyrophosphorylase (carboxylating)